MRTWIKEKLHWIALAFRKPKYGPKVFCIGYNKTGTTTLGKSFEMLGLRNSSFNKRVWREYYGLKQYEKVLEYAAKFDSCDDLPWLKEDMIPRLDKAFPGSKFVYLTREEDSWKKSYLEWTHKMTGVYPDADKGYENYQKHETFVMDYFKDREGYDFIMLSVKDKQGFKKLAAFLNIDTDRERFPHFNKTAE